MVRKCWLAGVLLGIVATGVWAKQGTVKTKDGDAFSGEVVEDDKFVTITAHGIATKIDKRNVADLKYTASVDDQINDRLAKLAKDDVKGRIDLAKWASENQRTDLAVKILEDARKIDPMNKEAGTALDNAQSQLDFERQQAAKAAAPKATTPATPATPTTPVAPATLQPTGKEKPKLEFRQLNAEEINTIRQMEMQPNDPKIQVRFDNNVVRTYLASGEHDKIVFNKMRPMEQAQEILATGDPKLTKNVHITTEPDTLIQYKLKVNPLVATSCGSTACHGGTKHNGDFVVYTGQGDNAVYSNFYVLQNYSKTIKGIKYTAIDRTLPERSLFLQYSLPADQSQVSHPQENGYRPRFRTKNEPGYVAVMDWIQTLAPIEPDYGINVSARVPTTQPADADKAK